MHENYGGILQAYATVSYLENQNIEYELVRYTRKKTVTEALKDVPRLFNAVWFNSRYEGIQRKLSLIGFIIYCGWFIFHLVRTWSLYSKMRMKPENYTNRDP